MTVPSYCQHDLGVCALSQRGKPGHFPVDPSVEQVIRRRVLYGKRGDDPVEPTRRRCRLTSAGMTFLLIFWAGLTVTAIGKIGCRMAELEHKCLGQEGK